jgi:hypothetical protein
MGDLGGDGATFLFSFASRMSLPEGPSGSASLLSKRSFVAEILALFDSALDTTSFGADYTAISYCGIIELSLEA